MCKIKRGEFQESSSIANPNRQGRESLEWKIPKLNSIGLFLGISNAFAASISNLALRLIKNTSHSIHHH